MRKSQNKSNRKLERSHSKKKQRQGVMMSEQHSHRNPGIEFKGSNNSGYRQRLLSANKRMNQYKIRNEYAITQSDEKAESRQRSRKLSKELKFKEIQRRHQNKIEKDIELHRNQLKKRRSQGSLGSVTNSSAASLHNNSNEAERMDSKSTRKIDKRRYVTMAIRSQRYIKMSPQNKPIRDGHSKSKDQQIKMLIDEIEEYKAKYDKALRAVQKLSQTMKGQSNKHFLEKQIYEQKIRILKAQLESKNVNKKSGTLGHIYYYKEFRQHQIVPESLIMEQKEQSMQSGILEEHASRDTVSRAQKLIQQFANMPQNSSGIKSNLSIESK